MNTFPQTSVTLIAKIRNLGPDKDAAEWVRFWDSYALAIRTFAALKGGEENADDIVMQVLGKLVEVLRSGQYTPEKGKFHSYLATMIVNEIHSEYRRSQARAGDSKVSLDVSSPATDEAETESIDENLSVPSVSPEEIDKTWREAVLKSAVEHVLTKTALSERDRAVYRDYVQAGEDITVVAKRYGITRNSVSQIKTRIEKRIVAFGRQLAAGEY